MPAPYDYTTAATLPFAFAFQQGLGAAQDRQANAQAMDLNAAQEQRAQVQFGQQNMLFDQGQQDRAAEQQAAQAAALAEQQKQAAMQADLAGLGERIASGSYSYSDFAQLAVKYPELATELKAVGDGLSTERKQVETSAAVNVISAIKSGKPEIAVQMLEERAVAAENAGDQMEADQARATAAIIKADPAAGIAAMGMTLSVVAPDVAKLVLGEAPTGPEWRAATPQEAAAYGASGGQVNIKTGEFKDIKPPSGGIQFDENGRIISIGGPAKADPAIQADVKAQSTDVILNAAQKARSLIGWTSTGLIGQGAARISATDAAEIVRQVEVLKANASAENIAAMRRASPTGGALGAVSDKDIALLAAKSGAIDPFSGPQRFAEQLDDYERTLLRIVHGVEEGDRIFKETRAKPGDAGADGSGSPVPSQAEADALLQEFGGSP